MDDLYRANILEHFRDPHHKGALEHPDASYEDISTSCGDRIRMDFAISDAHIADVRFDGQGCAISQAAASMLTDMLPGLSLEQALALDKQAILDELGISVGPSRQKCATLGLNAMKRALAGSLWADDEEEDF
jgi:nitrogen fixation protein NifU and related proteins